MSEHSQHSRKHHRKSLFARLLGRITGKKKQSSMSRDNFPGINLPENYDPVAWQDQSKSAELPTFLDPKEAESIKYGHTDFETQDRAKEKKSKHSKPKHKKRSLREAFELFMKKQALRREERRKQKIKRQHRRKSEEEFRKMNKGPALSKRLLNIAEAEQEREKNIPVFSQRNPAFRKLTIVVNSVLIFITTYILVYLFYWLTCMLVASFFGIDSILYYYDLRFNDHSQLWNRLNILMVTGIPPFFSLFLGIFLLRVIFKIKRLVGLQKLFVLWTAFHLVNHFFGAFPSGIITAEGFGYVAAWLYMNTAFKFMFSLVSLFVLGLIGYYSATKILETSDSLHRVKGENRLSFLFYQMAIPWFISTALLLIIRIPENFNYPYETLMLFSTVFLVIPPFFNRKVKPELNLLKTVKRRNINYGYLAMMIVLLAFLRIMLGIGLHFIIEISISISPATS
jgi:hypothetical protein